ncbi:hypothetical protein VTH06DRAFT_4488 [Thermothelomyces fergusii]
MHPSILDTSIIDLLEADPRPSLIVALTPHPPTVVYANPAFAPYSSLLDLITAKRDDSRPLWEWITGGAYSPTQPGSEAPQNGCRPVPASFSYSNIYWTRSVVHEEMVVVGANEQAPPSQPRDLLLPRRVVPVENEAETAAATAAAETSGPPVVVLDAESRSKSTPAALPAHPKDRPERPPSRAEAVQSVGRTVSEPAWILPDTTPEQRPFLDDINSVDWARTPLGPMRSWHPKLDETINQILVDSRPIAVYWGPSYTTVYNEAFSKLCGSKHPSMLGMPVQEAWAEAGQRLKETMRAIPPNKKGVVEDEWRFFVEREAEVEGGEPWLEETYLKWSMIPIVEDNKCLGFMHPVAETTSVRLWERRMKMLIELGEVLVTARDVESYWEKVIQELAAVEPRYDIPLAILYTVEDDTEATDASSSSSSLSSASSASSSSSTMLSLSLSSSSSSSADGPAKICRLAGTLGVPENHPIAPETMNLRASNEPLPSAFGRAIDAPHPVLLRTSDGTFPPELLEGLQWRGFGDPCRAAVICPIRPTKEESVMGFLLLGLNPRRPYDNDYRQFISLLSQKLATSLASIVLLEEEARRGRSAAEQAAVDQAMLKEKLEVQTKEANESLQMFEAVADFEKEEIDLASMEDVKERHVLASCRAEYAADGSLVRVLTCLTDVTPQKRVAGEALRRAQQAENLKRMAEFATVGLYDMDLDGRLLGANTVFFEMCGLRKVDPAVVDVRPWQSCVHEEDYSVLTEKLEKMVREDKVQNVEVRLNTTWTADDGSGHKVVVPRWVQATLLPVKTAEGKIQSFTGCLSDVSLQKWQLDWEKERKEEAIESKRQQENFIDMTSHEMRNPLSAIIHCADAITATLCRLARREAAESTAGAAEPSEDWASEARELVDNCIDNAETIVTCAQHQKRIVDDILTMSKLDSSLISITRVMVDPIKMVKEALKMFEVEARRVDINLSMVVDPCYHELNIKYLVFDPSRLKQVLINLLTNALKFTKTGPTRNVTVAVSASLTEPTEATSKVSFIPRSQESLGGEIHDHPVPVDRSNPVFLMFEVEDTGEGLTEEEKKSLFQRFVQASSRTHVKYGGSGLGLFISRRLAELQHGSIGVSSEPGVGSTFAFYIEAYRPTEEALREAETSGALSDPAVSDLRAGASLSRRGSNRRAISTTSTLASESTVGTPTTSGASPTATAAATPTSETGRSPTPVASPAPQITGVLVVEDNLINQQITRRGLLSMGFTVDVANHGIEALDKLRRTDRYHSAASSSSASTTATGAGSGTGDSSFPFPPSAGSLSSSPPPPPPPLSSTSSGQPIGFGNAGSPSVTPPAHPFPLSMILMDIEMPVQDGLTCTRNIRELERAGKIVGGRIPIIAVSANARMEQILEAKEAGCDDVLVKPYRMPELLERMKTVMGKVVGSAGANGPPPAKSAVESGRVAEMEGVEKRKREGRGEGWYGTGS